MQHVDALDARLTTAIYSFAEAARMLDMPSSTLRGWGTSAAGPQATHPLVTSLPRQAGSRAVVPFVGLAEAYALRAFRAAGVPAQRIRPALVWLEENLGLRQALASERLMTDGAEVLYDFTHSAAGNSLRDEIDGLVVVRSGQQVFRPVVRDYLARVTYRDGWAGRIRLPSYPHSEIVADPLINGGAPTFLSRGVRLNDVVNRVQAGESPAEVADDYGLPPDQVAALVSVG